jgi:hypothetical protein
LRYNKRRSAFWKRAYLWCQFDTGLLVSSGMVEAQGDGADIRYGGHGLAFYAALVHEWVEQNHPNGGQHHYLSQPFLAATGDMAQRLAADIAPRLRP